MQSVKDGKSTKEIVLEAIINADPSYVTIQDIADVTKLSRETVSKYMLVLKAEGKITATKKIGKAILYEAVKYRQ